MSRKDRTTFLTKEEACSSKEWILIDARGKVLGRLASEIAKILRGKHKVTYTPHVDCGDGVVVVNADKIKVTGAKEAQKGYGYYTGSIGGRREISYRVMMQKKPEAILQHAVRGMVPRTKLGNAQLKRLRLFNGKEHNMQAQQPTKIDI